MQTIFTPPRTESGAAVQLRSTESVLAGMRIFAGLLWLANLLWKLPPDFGKHDARGLLYSFHTAERYGIGPLADVVHSLVIPHFTLFGWLVFTVELIAGVLLLTGVRTRIGAAIGLAQAIAITLLVSSAPTEWRWGYLMLIGMHVVLLLTPCAARFSIYARTQRG